jgi:putative glutamine amidotransferase
MTLLIGIPACTRDINGHPQHATPARYGAALMGASGAVPVLIPPVGEAAAAILDRLDGLLLSGSPSNVDPSHYDAMDETPDLHDLARDGTTMPLIRAALRRGMPILAICRGIQELNVALGGSLHQQVHFVEGRLDHRGGPGPKSQAYAPKHEVALSGELARLLGRDRITVNSVHGQAIDRVAERLAVEAVAPDGTIEAVRVQGAAFALAVQWHPEWDYAADTNSVALFRAFGDACRAYAGGLRHGAPSLDHGMAA